MQRQTIGGMIGAAADSILRMSRSPVNYWDEFGLDIPLGVVLIFEGLRHDDIQSFEVFLTTPKAILALPRRCGTYCSVRGTLFRITKGFRHGPS
jgi:hypothetical protein